MGLDVTSILRIGVEIDEITKSLVMLVRPMIWTFVITPDPVVSKLLMVRPPPMVNGPHDELLSTMEFKLAANALPPKVTSPSTLKRPYRATLLMDEPELTFCTRIAPIVATAQGEYWFTTTLPIW